MRECIRISLIMLFGLLLLACANAADTKDGYSNKFTVTAYDDFTGQKLSGADIVIYDDSFSIVREGTTDRYGKAVFYMPYGKYSVMGQYGGHDRCGFWDGYFSQYKTSIKVYIGGECP